jgi:hypothetical protein
MINESKINDPRQWKKWRESGAVGEHPDSAKKRENIAQEKLIQRYSFNTDALPKESLKEYMRKKNKYNEENLSSYFGASYEREFDKIVEHPELTEEEYARSTTRYGTTNNFWQDFFPNVTDIIKKSLADGELPDKNLMYNDTFYFQQTGALWKAFSEIGFERVQKMHDALQRYLELDKKWKKMAGESPTTLWHDSWQLESSPLSQEERAEFRDCALEFTNTLRRLAIVLRKEGISAKMMHK